jgi:hypothetical protein
MGFASRYPSYALDDPKGLVEAVMEELALK